VYRFGGGNIIDDFFIMDMLDKEEKIKTGIKEELFGLF